MTEAPHDRQSVNFSIVEATTPVGCLLKPAMDCIPSDSLDASDGRFVHPFGAESRDLIKDCAPVLESIVRGPYGCV